VPVLHWTGRHHLRSVVLVWGQLIRDTASRYGTPNNNNNTGGDCQYAPARWMNVKGDQQQREGTRSWAVEGGGGRWRAVEGEARF
jgi:hypothetical protein